MLSTTNHHSFFSNNNLDAQLQPGQNDYQFTSTIEHSLPFPFPGGNLKTKNPFI